MMFLHLSLIFALSLGCVAARQPNFIFFQPDEMRAESLGCYGHPVSKTPNFDRFAANGVRFDQAHVSYTVCTQSRVAFMTGWPTHVRGHRSLWSLLHDWEPNLLKYLKEDGGYTVKWWGKNDLLAHDSWNRSVTTARSMHGKPGLSGGNAFQMGEAGYYSFLNEANGDIEHENDYANVAAAIDFLRSKPDHPFMIFLPLSRPHPPYTAPKEFYDAIDPQSLPPLRPPGGEGKPDYHSLIRQYRNLTSLDDDFFRRLHAVYLGSISFQDHLFGLLMDALKSSGFADSTTVAVFADHGDYAGDYGLVEKWPSGLEDVLTRVPLIVRTPKGATGHVVQAPVQLFDIVPTVLELAGLPAKHVHFGQSLVPQLHGHPGDPNRAVFAEGGYSTLEPRDAEGDPSQGPFPQPSFIYYPKLLQQQQHPLSVMRAASVRTMTHKLVVRSDPTEVDWCSELYDLNSDPLEMQNLYNNESYAGVKADLKQKLFQWFMWTSDVTPWQEDPRNGGYPWPSAPTDSDVLASVVRTGLPIADVAGASIPFLSSASVV
eukprot:TRINITY_DN14799_c0_g1_i1.p1 TRINITY_DN14799_c0_g1~~TRINITY_DN14799_c0_g1_i1.p1  ORF type:complete len:542 (+),score=50.82 TRINITY_DN14799_c0_g1_i1:49-1674(+)